MKPPGRKQAQGTSSSDGMSGASDEVWRGSLDFIVSLLFADFYERGFLQFSLVLEIPQTVWGQARGVPESVLLSLSCTD